MAVSDAFDQLNSYVRGLGPAAEPEDEEPTEPAPQMKRVIVPVPAMRKPASSDALEQLRAEAARLSAPELPDSKLQGLENQAAQRRAYAMLGQAGSNFADAFKSKGAKSQTPFWDRYAAAGDEAVQQYREHQKRVMDRAKAAAAVRSEAAKLQEARDERAAENERADKKLAGDRAYKEAVDAALRKAKTDEEAAKDAREKTQEEERNKREKEEEAGRFARNAAEARAQQARAIAAARTNAQIMANVRSEERAEERAAKGAEGVPEGWEAVGTPSEDDKKKFKGALGSQLKLGEMTREMRRLVSEASAAGRLLPGTQRDRIKQLATMMKIEAKNIAELGALSGPDTALMEAIAGDPTEVTSVVKGNADKMLDGLDRWASTSLNSMAKSHNFRRAGAKPAAKSGGLTAAEKAEKEQLEKELGIGG